MIGTRTSVRGRWLWLLAWCVSAAAVAYPVQDQQSIKAAARGFLEEQTGGYATAPEVSIGRLDSRLRLHACETPLEAFLPQTGGRLLGNVTVGVRCSGPKPWTLYVQAQVKVMAPVVVASRPLSRGEILGAGDLEIREQDLARLTTGYFEVPGDVVGSALTRSVQTGMALAPNMLEQPRVVRRGDRVAIVAESSRFQVRMDGEAMGDGAEGESIRVRNLSSKRIVEAVVIAPGVVQVRY